ncbi:MAG: signal recognition particle-docking protein FtsY [Proteobacteria bacterium]|nr:signal recognition particle-docking protein FtsY [Pseudomonadota bacterium]MCP4921604.1 signal recognition particle-docking protein FtsY [Pseudomonadota bacterium]
MEVRDAAESGETAEVAEVALSGPSVLDRFRAGFARTSSALANLFGGDTVDDDLFEALEEALISADVGVKTSMKLVEELRQTARSKGIEEPGALREELKASLKVRLGRFDTALNPAPPEGPHVLLVVGVNGSGKTTSIGKLAKRFKEDGKSVCLGAGDTFRAGAIEQLRVWAQRAGVDIVAHQDGADSASVLFDTLKAADARGHDVVLCDTAGRLQSKKPLMEELGKVTRVVGKACPGAPHEVLLVLDGTMGQNALSQAKTFGEVTGVTGVVLTKLDGTAKGGVVVAVMEELGMAVKFVGIGEGIDDLRPFDADAFVDALL